MTHAINDTLLDLAAWKLNGEKEAFVPPGAEDPAAGGGGMPPDPMAGGGGMPPDPMAGGAPPDPMAAAAAGALPPPGGLDPMMQQAITQAVQQAMAGGAGPASAGPAGPGKGSAKIDPGLVYMELGRIRKMFTNMFENLGWELPPDILDDNMVAQSVIGQDPSGTPTDAAGGSAPPDPAAAAGPPPGLPGIGQSPGINPVEAVGGGMGGEPKMGSIRDIFRSGVTEVDSSIVESMNDKLDALAALSRSLNR
jgi:hypothetical protein